MSGYVAGLCYEVKFGCPTTKAVAVALADHAWQDGTKAFPSIRLLADKCEVSTRTVQRALRRLEQIGVLVIVKSGGCGPRDTREWKFDLHLLRTVAATETKQIIPDAKGDKMAHSEDELRVTPVTAKGDTGDAKGDTGVTRTVNNLQEPRTAPLPPTQDEAPPSGQSDDLEWKGAVRPILIIKPGEGAWTRWVDHIEAKLGRRAADAVIMRGELEVTTRWPNDETPLPNVGRVPA